MARYIDADELKNRIEKERSNLLFLGCLATAETIECRVLPLIDKQPTADVVEVVRCYKCTYGHINPNNFSGYCRKSGNIVYASDFCSEGERREDVREPDKGSI